MKVAVTGKGGVGKTTLASLLARLYGAEGRSVIAIDADPDANLASALGIPPEEAAAITPIADMDELIEERTGAKPGTSAPYFRLNPRVDDIPERFSARVDGVKLLRMGTVRRGGGGCVCPESALLKSLLTHVLLRTPEVVIIDMEAGVEHLGRATASGVDALIVVVEPGRRSLQTAEQIRRLAQDIGLSRIYVVGCKVQNQADRDFIAESLTGLPIIGYLSFSQAIMESDRKGLSVYEADVKAVQEAREIKSRLEQLQAR